MIRCFVKSLMATSTYFENEKRKPESVFWAPEFGRPNRYIGLSNGVDTSLIILTMFSEGREKVHREKMG